MTVTLANAPVLQTERLTLRALQAGDWPAYRAYRLSPRSTLPEGPDAEATAHRHFDAFFQHWTQRGFGRFILTDRASGAPIGHAGPFATEDHPEPELTWTIWDTACEGRGLAFEAAQATRDFAFGTLGWATAVSYIAPGNDRSIALALRLGARPDPAAAPMPGYPCQVYRHPAPEAVL